MVSGDPNLMEIGAEQCTRLNSDEETGFDEEPEEEDDDSGWSEDWSLGELTDEDEVGDPNATMLPDSLCLSAARNKKVLKNMRKTGWEYGAFTLIQSNIMRSSFNLIQHKLQHILTIIHHSCSCRS